MITVNIKRLSKFAVKNCLENLHKMQSNLLSNISSMLWLLKKDDSTESNSNHQFIHLTNPVTDDDLEQFIPELQNVIQQLDCLLTTVYKDTKRPDLKAKMDKLVTELKTKKAKIEYLSGFNKTAVEAITAMEKDLLDQDKKLKETEIERSRLNKRGKGLRERLLASKQATTRNPYNYKIPLPASKLPWPKCQVDKKNKTEPALSTIRDVVLYLNPIPLVAPLKKPMAKIDEEDLDEWDDVSDYETDLE